MTITKIIKALGVFLAFLLLIFLIPQVLYRTERFQALLAEDLSNFFLKPNLHLNPEKTKVRGWTDLTFENLLISNASGHSYPLSKLRLKFGLHFSKWRTFLSIDSVTQRDDGHIKVLYNGPFSEIFSIQQLVKDRYNGVWQVALTNILVQDLLSLVGISSVSYLTGGQVSSSYSYRDSYPFDNYSAVAKGNLEFKDIKLNQTFKLERTLRTPAIHFSLIKSEIKFSEPILVQEQKTNTNVLKIAGSLNFSNKHDSERFELLRVRKFENPEVVDFIPFLNLRIDVVTNNEIFFPLLQKLFSCPKSETQSYHLFGLFDELQCETIDP